MMKKKLVFLSLVLFFISCGSKETKKEIVPEKKVEEIKNPEIKEIKKEEPKPILIFTVQIGAFKKKNSVLASLKDIQISFENTLYKYRQGTFQTYQEAKNHQKIVQNKFPGAFVQALKNGQRIGIKEAIK